MDDLIGGLFALFAIAALVAIAIAAAITVVASIAALGAVVASLLGIAAFAGSLSSAVMARGGERRVPRDPEPAFELYVLGQLRRDVRQALEEGWKALQQFRVSCQQYADQWDELPWVLLGMGIILGAWTGMVTGAIGAGLLALPVLIVAGIFSGAAWVLVGILRAAEWLRRKVRHAHYECPEDHERFALPIYLCPACGAEHRQLVPGRWGIVRRECRCGQAALPTMVLNGRQRIPQQCPSGHPMAGLIGFAENLRVAIVAGASAGKTTYLGAAMMALEELSSGGRLAIDVLEQSRTSYQQTLDALRNGRLPQKTTLGTNPALVAEIQGDGKRSRVLYAYDVAGESYQGSDETRQLRFLEVPSALLLLVDPLAIPQVATDHAEQLARDPDAVRVSPQDPMRVLERTVAALREAGMDPNKLPVAIVVAKVDAFGIGDEIEALERAQPGNGARAWLDQHGAGNLVRLAEQEFKQVGWFGASALGRVPQSGDERAFAPRGVAAPLLWLLERRGVVPAAGAFAPVAQQQRLEQDGAGAAAPIGTAGWAWRGGVSALGVLALVALVVVGIALLAGGGSSSAYDGASASDVSAASDASAASDTSGGSSGGSDSSSSDTTSGDSTDSTSTDGTSGDVVDTPEKQAVQDTLTAWGKVRNSSDWCALMTPGFRQRIYHGHSHAATMANCLADHNHARHRTYEVLDMQLSGDGQLADADVYSTPSGDQRHYRFAQVDGEWRVADNGSGKG
jgi:hypothetical protein